MKRASIFFIMVVVLLGCKKPGDTYYNQKVNQFALSLRLLVNDVECYKEQNLKYPNMPNDEFVETFLRRNFADQRIDAFTYHAVTYQYITDDNFIVNIISNLCNNQLCTVVKINSEGVYWKDCFARLGDNISDIDWNQVNSIALPTIRDKSGSFQGSGYFNILEYQDRCPEHVGETGDSHEWH